MGQHTGALEIPFIRKLSTAVGFDTASTGVGVAVQIDVEEQMHEQNASAWVRIPFEVEDPQLLDMMRLQMKYNDGFVAYVNGVKVAEDNAPAAPVWNSTATAARSVAESLTSVEFDISAHLNVLRAGENVLALHGLNVSAADADFLILPDLLRNSRQFFDNSTPEAVNSQGYPAPSAPVEILTPGGTFVGSMVAEITTAAAGAVIRYTLDETLPVESSPQYTGPITINTTQQLRARAFQPGQSPGPVATETYVALGDAYVQNFTSDLPIIVLDDFSGGKPTSQRPAYMAIFDTAGGRSSMTTGMDVETRIGIKTRGSSTGGRDKVSYSIEAWQQEINDDVDIAPLGMPADSDWVLYGPYNFDRALIRNAFIYELSNQVDHYAVRTQFVEVFFNMGGGSLRQDDYRGVYVWMEKIKRGPDRVDVANLEPGDNAEPEVTGGFIIKVDRRDPGDSGFSAGGQGSLNYVDPKEKNDITTAQKAYIKKYIDDFATALNGSNFKDPDLGYAAYLDVESAINQNILRMLMKDPDAFRLSGYLHKDREGLLEYGPLWDADRTMGCDDDNRAWDPTSWDTTFFTYSWFNRLFQDIDFDQRYIDQWQAWRQGAFSSANMDAIIDSMAAELQEAQVRNFDKWSGVRPKNNTPFPATYQGEIDWMKDWLQRRTTWVDGKFAPMPGISHGGGVIAGNVSVTLAVPSGTTVYYTTDGHDPRNSGGGIYANASVYTPGLQIHVDSNTRIIARSYSTNHTAFPGIPKLTSEPEWSGPTTSTFVTGDAPGLTITEINYNPHDPTPAELAINSALVSQDFEFIELQNTSGAPVDLIGVELVDGVRFDFTDSDVTSLAAGEYVVVVNNPAAFQARYGSGINVAGRYEGLLNSAGEGISLQDGALRSIADFKYSDSGAWPGRPDGKGATLELIDPAAVPADATLRIDYLEDGENWQSSVAYGGTPGADPAPHQGVVINEVLSHTDWPATDSIELHNVTDSVIDLAGWYLSDQWGWDSTYLTGNYKKYRFPFSDPAKSMIAVGGYLVVTEYDFNPDPNAEIPDPHHFAIDSAHSDDVWLMKADAAGNLTHFGDHVGTGVQANAQSWGRWPNGGGVMYPMTSPTLGSANSGPLVGPLIISELQYYPGIFHENFAFGGEDRFTEVLGNWAVAAERYDVTPFTPGGDSVATIDLADPLLPDYVLQGSVRSTPAAGGYGSNGLLIFDYHSPTDFKFAGAFADAGEWRIGHRNDTGWIIDAVGDDLVVAGVNYDLKLRAVGSMATLFVEGDQMLQFDFGETLHDGLLGIGTAGSISSFGTVSVQPAAEGDLEFVEICNPSAETIILAQLLPNPHVPGYDYLSDWRLSGGVEMGFDEGLTIAPGQAIVVLSFNPDKPENEARIAAFRDYYGLDESVTLVGGYKGSLDNGGERVRLQAPDAPPNYEPYYVPHLLVDEIRYEDNFLWPGGVDGNGLSLHRIDPSVWGDHVDNWTAEIPSPGTASFVFQPRIDGRYVFYNNSTFDTGGPTGDDLAIATDKVALRPGSPAKFANYTSYDRGINGIMVDLANLPDGVIPDGGDFQFRVGDDDPPGQWNWIAAAEPSSVTFHPGAGKNDTDRVSIVWEDGAIRNEWLQVTVSSAKLGMAVDDVFYFGNAVADSGDSLSNADVTITDLLLARNNPRDFLAPASVEFRFDYNRDTFVNAIDVLLARNNQTGFFNSVHLIDLSNEPAAAEPAAAASSATDPVIEQWAWLLALEQLADRDDSPEEPDADYRILDWPV
ncbi:MAG: CotH kinase family protein [Candidatus Nealsonbacteria bacterium]|nr:CotH kinase family protein [Candidatus Nealsonbacteria bacterium]